MMKLWGVLAAAALLMAGCDDGGGAGDDDATAEVCTGGVDDDGDGQIDCADTDCSTNTACQQAGEICDDHADNDGDMLLDCSDPDCVSAKAARGVACAPGSFGEFENRDGSYSSGSGDCAFTQGFAAVILMHLSVGGIVFPVLGENTNAFFSFVGGTTNQATGTGLIVLGAGNHTCTVTISGTGVVTITIACTNPGGGSCSQTYSFVP